MSFNATLWKCFCRKSIINVIITSNDYVLVFTALHGMQTRSKDENSVCPSVKRVHCDKTKELSV